MMSFGHAGPLDYMPKERAVRPDGWVAEQAR